MASHLISRYTQGMLSIDSKIFNAIFRIYNNPWATSLAVLVAMIYIGYLFSLPKPLPGIPYNLDAVGRLMGDVPSMMDAERKGGRPRLWFAQQARKHNSAIFQVFLEPLGHPSIVLVDFWESLNLMRRSEFDRGTKNGIVLGGVLPQHHTGMNMTDPRYKGNKELLKDLMTPKFLNTVSAPEVYKKVLHLIDLWRLKSQIANGRPFRADEDMHSIAFDIIMAAAIGQDDYKSVIITQFNALKSQAILKHSINEHSLKQNIDRPYPFPPAPVTEELMASTTHTNAVGIAITMPSSWLFFKVYNMMPWMRNAYNTIGNLLQAQIQNATQRISGKHGEYPGPQSALDHMMQREINIAQKNNRPPDLQSQRIQQELYGYILAGHDTLSSALAWALKYLALYEDIQEQLRRDLRVLHPDAYRECRQLTASEAKKLNAPLLDAFVEEVLRLEAPIGVVIREAMTDTTIMGHHIPRGAQVFITVTGPSYTEPRVASFTSETSTLTHSQNGSVRDWSEDFPVDQFRLDRWLRQDPDTGKLVFDSQNGPFLSFGAGHRACFGRRLAYLEIKTVLALLIWNFELGKLPEELNTWDAKDYITAKAKTCYVRLAHAI